MHIEDGRSYRFMAARSSSFEEDDMIKAASTRFVVCFMYLITALYLGTLLTIAFKILHVGFLVPKVHLRCSHSGDKFVKRNLGIGVSNQSNDQAVTLEGVLYRMRLGEIRVTGCNHQGRLPRTYLCLIICPYQSRREQNNNIQGD